MKIRWSDIGLALAVCAVAVATWVGCSREKTNVKEETPRIGGRQGWGTVGVTVDQVGTVKTFTLDNYHAHLTWYAGKNKSITFPELTRDGRKRKAFAIHGGESMRDVDKALQSAGYDLSDAGICTSTDHGPNTGLWQCSVPQGVILNYDIKQNLTSWAVPDGSSVTVMDWSTGWIYQTKPSYNTKTVYHVLWFTWEVVKIG